MSMSNSGLIHPSSSCQVTVRNVFSLPAIDHWSLVGTVMSGHCATHHDRRQEVLREIQSEEDIEDLEEKARRSPTKNQTTKDVV